MPTISSDGEYRISLTGPDSHLLVRERGVGSLSIGPRASRDGVDLYVEPGLAIHWSSFDDFTTPSGYPWPRWIEYTGDDVGVFEWARSRPLERLRWVPTRALTVDARDARIGDLEVDLVGHGLHMRLPAELRSLSLSGAVERFACSGEVPRSLRLEPTTSRRATDAAVHLPDLGAVNGVRSLSIRNGPLKQPVSLSALAQFSGLESLSLHGAIGDLARIGELPKLTALELRFMPRLDGLPALGDLPLLDHFVACNVVDSAGKILRQQIKTRAKLRPWTRRAATTQLRDHAWFVAEYGRPFSAWSARQAKVANAAFDEARKALSQARSVEAAKAAIVAFTRRFNALEGIETAERESIGDAVGQLIAEAEPTRALGVTPKMAAEWFDGARDY